MPTYQYADQATKTLIKAIPTLNAEGKVKKWAVEMRYSLNGYKSTYSAEVEGSEFGALKAPGEFTKAEILGECPTNQWDMVFDSQYESVMVAVPDQVVGDFDVNSLE